jgi:O-antigen ligase
MQYARAALLLGLWLALLFFPEGAAAPAIFAGLAAAAAAVTLFLVVREGRRAPASPAAPGDWAKARLIAAWPYLAYLVALTIAWRLHPADASSQEYLRQLCFLATVAAVAQGARGATARWVAVIVVGLALIVVQILGPHSVVDALGRPLHYRSIQQWSGYPEIGLLAALGAVGSLALMLADRRWRVRVAGALLACGFAGATIYLLSRFSLITIGITGVWLSVVSAVVARSRLALSVLLACLVVVLGLVVVRGDVRARVDRIFRDRTAAVDIRSEGWRVAMAMMREHPVLGVGPGRYREEYPHYSSTGDSGHAYNIVLHEGAELGYLGLAAYLAMWARVLWRSLRAAGRSAAGVAALATHGMLVAFFLRSQSEHFLANLDASFRVLLLLAFLFGLAEAASASASAAGDGGFRSRRPRSSASA